MRKGDGNWYDTSVALLPPRFVCDFVPVIMKQMEFRVQLFYMKFATMPKTAVTILGSGDIAQVLSDIKLCCRLQTVKNA